ncbi:hypothetical protein [Flammeovirga aprica]|uniref:Uncharacterized protein n=1 Tax=Flammeovirga aprica JL-4 TaxID=694437 RepID=A0A7X9RWD6_9BACT|nr:hypothetical protein [Flammeovirga aprica]NME69938.1 hypothetical protein [Flammeovirga aprica JL-4]
MEFFLNTMLDQGVTMSFVGCSLVFASLIAFFFLFTFMIPCFMELIKNIKKSYYDIINEESPEQKESEIKAAIMVALFQLKKEPHIEEDMIITIKRNNSQWGVKGYYN